MTDQDNRIHRYADLGDGRRNLGIDVSEHVSVLISPQSTAAQEEAERVATLFVDHRSELEHMRSALSECRGAIEKAKARAIAAESALSAALSGTRRLFGRVLMKPSTAGAWNGEVWLLDPERKERGLGLRFDSVADVRIAYPELWVVDVTNDGVLLDAAPLARKP